MRVCLDARKILDSGLGNYIRGLLLSLDEMDSGVEWDLIIRAEKRPFERMQEVRKNIPRSKAQIHFHRSRDYSMRELCTLAAVINRTAADFFHAPHYVVPLGVELPYVVTVHDLIHLRFPRYFPAWKRAYARWMLQRACRNACRVLTISQCTKRDLVEILGVAEEKIHITYSGINRRYFSRPPQSDLEQFRRRQRLPAEYLLYVGNLKPHKNVAGLMRVWASLPDSIRPPLVIVGAKIDSYEELRKQALKSGRDAEIFFPGVIAEEDMVALYQCAAAYVQPSYYEGFGAPPLEAMAAGIPTAVANRGAQPEIVGDAALVFDPDRSEEFAHTLTTLLTDPEQRKELVARGVRRAAEFTWERFARETLQVYRQIPVEL
jgi:glycosyltransferase involved in cell wall biosynthesis